MKKKYEQPIVDTSWVIADIELMQNVTTPSSEDGAGETFAPVRKLYV